MSNRAIIPEWWTEFSQVVLNNPKLTQVVIELAERDDGAMMAEALATDVTERRRAIDGKDGLGEDGRYEQSTLSTDLKNDLEPLGLVIRPAKAERPDQSIIYTVGWTIEYLAKQDLENGRPVDWSGDDQTAAMMEHTLDVTADEVPDVRHPVPLEGVLYTIADKHATVSGKEIHVEVGDPASFSDAAGTLAEKLYEADHEGQPLPKFPQHRDDTAWDDNYHDYAVVGEIHQVDEVPVFDDLKRDIESELKSWAAAAIELYVRENSEELPSSVTDDEITQPSVTDDEIAHRANKFATFARDKTHQRFGTRVVPDDDRIVFGLYCRHDVATGMAEAVSEIPE